MGSMGAAGMSEMVDEGMTSLEAAMRWHLQSNHYPPHPSFMIPVALLAVDLANKGLWGAEIELPEGVTHKYYGTQVPVAVVVEELHLQEFIRPEDVTVIEGEIHDPYPQLEGG